MKTTSELVGCFQESLIPKRSKSKYEEEWNNYLKFCEDQGVSVGSESIKAYVSNLHHREERPYSAFSIVSTVSMLKK